MALETIRKFVLLVAVLLVLTMSGCSSARSNLATCQYQADKAMANSKPPLPTDWFAEYQFNTKQTTLIRDCMRSRGFKYNDARSNVRYGGAGYFENIKDKDNWDRWWWAKLAGEISTFQEPAVPEPEQTPLVNSKGAKLYRTKDGIEVYVYPDGHQEIVKTNDPHYDLKDLTPSPPPKARPNH